MNSSSSQKQTYSSQPIFLVEQDFFYFLILFLGPMIEILGSLLIQPLMPVQVQTSDQRMYKWRTSYLARINAGITGVWAVWALHHSPSLRTDLLHGSSPGAIFCLLFSLGVHVVETLEMILHSQYSLLTVHHVGAVACCAGALASNPAHGFAIVCLVSEINTVFNKTRILHLVCDTDKFSLEYRVNAIINVATFFLRVLIVAWLHGQSFQVFVQEPNVFFTTCFLSMSFINIWNMSCFKTLVIKDILRKPKLA